jgi:hypothetical protein
MQTSRRPKTLIEIRLCRSAVVARSAGSCPSEDELWRPATQANRDKLQKSLAVGMQLFGPASHWLEERQA